MKKIALLSLFCFLLTGAHFLRAGNMTAVILCMGLASSFSPKDWLQKSRSLLLMACLTVWAVEAFQLIGMRWEMGRPWARLAAIMAGIVALHAWAVCLSLGRTPPLPTGKRARSLVFTLSLLILLVIDSSSPFPLLPGRRLVSWPGADGLLILALAWWGGFCAEGLSTPGVSGKRRLWMWGLFSSVFFLQFALGLTLLPSLLMTGKLHIPVPFMMISGPLYRGGGLFMIALFGVSVLLVGAAWCSHLCYFGSWDGIAAARSGKKLRPAAERPRKDWRWLALLLAVAAPLLLASLGVPAPLAAGAALAALMAAPLLWRRSSRLGIRTYCGYVCPMGLMAKLAGRLSPWRVNIQEDKCTGCQKCAAVCRDQAIHQQDGKCRVNARCTLCRDCLPQCAHGALDLRLSLPGLQKSPKADILFITLISLVHVIFLATARI